MSIYRVPLDEEFRETLTPRLLSIDTACYGSSRGFRTLESSDDEVGKRLGIKGETVGSYRVALWRLFMQYASTQDKYHYVEDRGLLNELVEKAMFAHHKEYGTMLPSKFVRLGLRHGEWVPVGLIRREEKEFAAVWDGIFEYADGDRYCVIPIQQIGRFL